MAAVHLEHMLWAQKKKKKKNPVLTDSHDTHYYKTSNHYRPNCLPSIILIWWSHKTKYVC